MPLCNKCKKQFPNRIILDGKPRNLSARKYCLECSQFNQHNTKKLEDYLGDTKRCNICQKFLPLSQFYTKGGKRKHEPVSNCKLCDKKRLAESARKMKLLCVAYKGGSCEICGYNKCVAALDFHHTDPNCKDFQISRSHTKSLAKVKPELDKCILLCSNCHRELHYNQK